VGLVRKHLEQALEELGPEELGLGKPVEEQLAEEQPAA
jgi:hypothetical protein